MSAAAVGQGVYVPEDACEAPAAAGSDVVPGVSASSRDEAAGLACQPAAASNLQQDSVSE